MRYLALFAGIHAPGVAWDALGWECVGFSEIEAFPCSVLKARHPEVPNLGDITKLSDERLEALRADGVDLVVGGSPCQSFSVAGLRKGLADPRGNLLLHFLRVVDRVRPRWVVWENVPGVLSSVSHESPDAVPPPDPVDVGSVHEVVVEDEYQADEVSAFACFVAGLRELGYGLAWGSLDAQHFHLAQRRERVFVVAHLGDGSGPFAVLLDRESLSGDPPPRREAGQGVARSLDTGSGGSSAKEQQRTFVGGGGLPLNPLPEVSRPLCAPRSGGGGSYRSDAEVETLIPETSPTLLAQGNSTGGDRPPGTTVDTAGSLIPVPQVFRKSRRAQSEEDDETWVEEDDETWVEEDIANTLNTFDTGDVRTTEAVVQPVAFSLRGREGGAQAEAEDGDLAPAVRDGSAGGSSKTMVAFAQNQREEVRDLGDCAGAVKTPGTHEQTFVAAPIVFDDHAVPGQDVSPTLQAGGSGGRNDMNLPCVAQPGYINPRQTRNSQSSNQVGIKPDAQVADALSTDGPGAVLAPAIPLDLPNATRRDGGTGVGTPSTGIGQDGDPSGTLRGQGGAAVVTLAQNGGDVQAGGMPHLRDGHGAGVPAVFWITNQPDPSVGADIMPTLSSKEKGGGRMDVVAFQERGREGGRALDAQSDLAYALTSPGAGGRRNEMNIAAPTLTAANDPSRSPQSEEVTRQVAAVHQATMAVRRLTPEECEALQGFPRGWTRVETRKVKHRKKCGLYDPEEKFLILGPGENSPCPCPVKIVPPEKCPDGPRYKALGNSMATTVVRWIGERIDILEDFLSDLEHPGVRCRLCGQATTWVPPGAVCGAPRLDGTACPGNMEVSP